MPKKDVDPYETTSPYQQAMMNVVASLMTKTLSDQDHWDRAAKRVSRTLFRDILGTDAPHAPAEEVSPEVQAEWDVVQGHLALAGMLISLRQTERYFRRYPFTQSTVSRADHLRNICEMYFDRVAQFRDRLKSTLNALTKVVPKASIPVGEVIKSFSKDFQWEIRNRNRVHHQGRYDDPDVDQLGIAELVGPTLGPGYAYFADANRLYRGASQRWAKRVRGRSDGVSAYLDIVASYILMRCPFVEPHIQPADLNQLDKVLDVATHRLPTNDSKPGVGFRRLKYQDPLISKQRLEVLAGREDAKDRERAKPFGSPLG